MRTLLAALCVLAVNVYYWAGLQSAEQFGLLIQARDAAAVKDAVIAAACLLLLVEGALLLKKGRQRSAAAGASAPSAAASPVKGQTVRPRQIDAEIINLLALFQERGRLLDFLIDDITAYSNDRVGAAARVVHQGCAEVLKEFFSITPLEQGEEGSAVVLAGDFNPRRYRLMGSIAGDPPFRGVVLHRGWKTSRIALPRVSSGDQCEEIEIISPTEVELRS